MKRGWRYGGEIWMDIIMHTQITIRIHKLKLRGVLMFEYDAGGVMNWMILFGCKLNIY